MVRFVIPILLCPALVAASTIEIVDLGPAIGRVGAVSAAINSGAATYYNPAGLAFRNYPQARVGIQMLHSELRLAGDAVDVGAPISMLVELAAPLPLLYPLDGVFAAGLTLQILPDNLLVIDAPRSTDPILPYYRNRTQRLVVMPGLAVRPHPSVALGIGANFFSGLTGLANVDEGTDGTLQANIEEEIVGRVSLHAGLRYQGTHLALGVSYRQRFVVDFRTLSDSYISDSRMRTEIVSNALFTPETVVFALAWAEERFDFGVDVSWRRWSDYLDPYARVDADLPLPSLGIEERRLVVRSEFAPPRTQDIVRLAFSARRRLLDSTSFFGAIDLSGGYAFEPSAFRFRGADLPSAITNVIDGPKHMFGLGLRWRAPDFWRIRVSVDAASQLHFMGETRVNKDPSALVDEAPAIPGRQTTNPGYPRLTGGGLVIAGMVSVSMEVIFTEAQMAAREESAREDSPRKDSP